MLVFLNSEDKVDYDKIDENTTVKDLLAAVDVFLSENPLPCDNCEESCCKKAWSVEMDNVCVNRLSGGSPEAQRAFVKEHLVKKKNYYRDMDQYVLNKEKNCTYITDSNKCLIYQDRPIICRLYLCSAKSLRYGTLRELVGTTYLKALVLEYRMNSKMLSEKTISKYKRNPVLLSREYDVTLHKIIKYGGQEGWIDRDESGMLLTQG